MVLVIQEYELVTKNQIERFGNDMCNYCEENSPECCIYIDPLSNDYYLDIETSEWDEYDDGFVHHIEYINYCP